MTDAAKAETMFLPSILAVGAADEKLASARSDLDEFVTAAERFNGDDVSLEDAWFHLKHGIALDERTRHVDLATILRLLVFADDCVADAEAIREDAERLRQTMLTAYHEFVIEAGSWRRNHSRGERDDG